MTTIIVSDIVANYYIGVNFTKIFHSAVAPWYDRIFIHFERFIAIETRYRAITPSWQSIARAEQIRLSLAFSASDQRECDRTKHA